MLRLGSGPGGPRVPWRRLLDELAAAGYHWLELGPYGYLPPDPNLLLDELAARDLHVCAGTVTGVGGPHGDFTAVLAETRRVAELTRALGASDVVFVPSPGYRDDRTGGYLEANELGEGQWRALLANTGLLGRVLADEYGLTLHFQPHADYQVANEKQVRRLLDGTDPRYVSLCLDTGHLTYRRADVLELIARHPDRIGCVHLRQVDPALAARADAEDLTYGQALAMGLSVTPPAGVPELPTLLAALTGLGTDLFVVALDVPSPFARRTHDHLTSLGGFI
ncbi:sugar phosphate isomerase/epimerase family protein [Actinoplanes lobatus]|uniref:Inosose dehydratase n=1 Tax=Actinoplanes lobatus TaxID=113568 RepID=A0A7W7MKN1_9ACTN|nr:sugar phosphate isomerase/epimerase [Actinoplanes lobatus]MBB4753917.1 inosose dehydratase [Actinoplanes lobatus]